MLFQSSACFLVLYLRLLIHTARVKARDARRQSDMTQIMTALNLFYDDNRCLPRPGSTGCISTDSNAGGWDYSSQGSFLPFLESAGYFSSTPVDPVNNMTGDGTPSGTYAYRYYCYTSGSNVGLHLGYWREQGGYIIFSTSKTTGGDPANSDYVCK